MRNSPLTHWAILSAPLLIILALVWFGFASEHDVELFFREHRRVHPDLRGLLKFLTDWSNPFFYGFYALMLAQAFRAKNRAQLRFILILLVVQGIVAGLCVHFLKYTIGRPRPGNGDIYQPLSGSPYNSLPSGHTTEITGWTLPLANRLAIPWFTIIIGLFVAAVGFSRIYLGWHHPSDVFFGWLLGSASGMTTTLIVRSTLFTRKG